MIKRVLVLAIALCLVLTDATATHIRAGEIIVQRVSNSSLRFKIIIIAYTDTNSNGGGGEKVTFGGGELDFGDGTVIENVLENPNVAIIDQVIFGEEDLAYNRIEFEHTFPGPGRYVIRYNEQNRNAGVLNMSNSVDTPFYIETEILLDPAVGINNTPSFLVAPIDRGAEGATFLHNPGAYDEDGDSLSYRLVEPKQFFDRSVNGYVEPNDAQFYDNFVNGTQSGDGPPIFKIDSLTGTVIWDAPGLLGEYNIAFVVDEWRKVDNVYARIGSVTRDMQVIIEETDNLPPIIEEPMEVCVQAGELLEVEIIATDPDGDNIELEAFGGPFEFNINPASFLPNPPQSQPQPASMIINWETDISHVRERPYEVQLKARDNGRPNLVDFKTLLITVVAPPPDLTEVTLETGRTARLTWDAYPIQADLIQIWRRVDTFEIDTEDCVVGMPATAGYMMIDTLANFDSPTSYVDDNGGYGLAPGALYCYRIVATFPSPKGGASYVSQELCQLVEVVAPVPLNIDIEQTSETDGEVYLRWISPYDVDPDDHPRPFSYDVYRFTEFGGTDSVFVTYTQDTIFTDTGVNTLDNQVFYRIHAYNANVDENNRRVSNGYEPYIDSSVPASSVWLIPTSQVESIDLNWQSNTPWSIVSSDFPQHYVYRAVGDGFGDLSYDLIDSTNVTQDGLIYIDDGSFNGEGLNKDIVYNYFVETKGTYGNELFPEPLLNKSQIVSAQPNDLIPPCTPVTFAIDEGFDCASYLAQRGCNFNDFSITLRWEEDGESECDNDISSYNIYYAEEDTVGGIPFFVNVVGTQFIHDQKSSFKGYYQISSVDRSGNESELSEVLIVDNCPSIRLPNAFSPNGDGVNDTFTPYTDFISGSSAEGESLDIAIPDFDNANCARFVESLSFRVFDRTGGTIFTYNEDMGEGAGDLINWDGKNDNGLVMPDGTYYYSLDVKFDALDPSLRSQSFNGWIQIIR